MSNQSSERAFSQRQLRVGELVKQNLGESTFKAIASDPERAKNEVCTSTPWRKTNFTTAGSDLQMFAKLSTPLIQNLCMCS